jgi:succinate-semialdehyde dehydrogenase/glutarate-semialdehyde dehydrogenase
MSTVHADAQAGPAEAPAEAPAEPFTGAPLPAQPTTTAAAVREVVRTVRTAQELWAGVPVRERAGLLLRFHDLLLDRQSEILDLIQRETGKARIDAFQETGDVAFAARYCARVAPRLLSEDRVAGWIPGMIRVRRLRRPVGVVGNVVPWNYPLTLAMSDALAAIVAGNGVVLKPDPQTALTALWGRDLLLEAGAPPGLLEVVTGDGATTGAALVDAVDHVCFTGATATGRIVGAAAGRRLVGASLELGGKNGLYVAHDAHLARAAEGALRDCFGNTGQLCVSIERLVLHEAIAEEFLALFLPMVRRLRQGARLDYTCDLGSLTTAAQFRQVANHVDDAVARGARVLSGGRARPELGPWFYAATVLENVPDEALCAQEETFGPVVSVVRVGSDDEAVRVVNQGDYGLNASVWSRDLRRAVGIARRIRAGTVSVNEAYTATWGSHRAEMGGIGASGLGRRHGPEGILRFTETQTIAVVHRPGLAPVRHLGGEGFARLSTGALRATRKLRVPWP